MNKCKNSDFSKDATHISNGCQKNGFTLAEVLITLGVIGVVAAITMPILIKNYQKMVWVNQLKVNYQTLNQIYKKFLSTHDEIEYLTDEPESVCSEYVESLDNYKACCNEVISDYSRRISEEIVKSAKYMFFGPQGDLIQEYYNFGGVKKVDGTSIVSDGRLVASTELTNGAMFYVEPGYDTATNEACNKIHQVGGRMCKAFANITLDVNGKKGPNIHGRDIFRFVITEKGDVVPKYGKDEIIFLWFNGNTGGIPEEAMMYDTDILVSQYFVVNNEIAMLAEDVDGCPYFLAQLLDLDPVDCTAYLIERNNWKMDY